jgi:hypothetical protein
LRDDGSAAESVALSFPFPFLTSVGLVCIIRSVIYTVKYISPP